MHPKARTLACWGTPWACVLSRKQVLAMFRVNRNVVTKKPKTEQDSGASECQFGHMDWESLNELLEKQRSVRVLRDTQQMYLALPNGGYRFTSSMDFSAPLMLVVT